MGRYIVGAGSKPAHDAGMKENQNIEWKESWRDDYIKWICGFANASGGTLVIGKNDKDIMIGERSPKSSPKTEDRIVELMRTNPSISTEEIGNRIGITKRAVLKQVEKLKLKGIVERIGPAKGG